MPRREPGLSRVFVADFITAVLLFNQSSVVGSRALLILANGYLFSALIVIPHALTFPGAFSRNGLLGAGIQSSGWLNVFWHLGFIAAVAGYAWLKDAERRNDPVPRAALPTFCWSAAIQLVLVSALTWGVTAGDAFMPRMFLDDRSAAPLLHDVAGTIVLLSALTLLLMLAREMSVLDLWVMAVIGMLITEMSLVTFGMTSRFSLGWYVSRALAVLFSTVVLIALLSEAMKLHVALSRSYVSLERERANKLVSIKAATSSIIHEVRQPLTAIVATVAAARRWLDRTPPDLAALRPLLDDMERASLRAEKILASVPRMFEDADAERQPIDMNKLTLETLQILREELKDSRIEIDVELAHDLPPVMGNRVQLQEVVLNLVRNAIEAMASSAAQGGSLKVRTRSDGVKALVMEVEDSGSGIATERLDRIFEAFVTTKPKGTGLGLAICRRIVQTHGGRLTASSDGKSGALFHLVLPLAPRAGALSAIRAG